jgi:hypothetical protein
MRVRFGANGATILGSTISGNSTTNPIAGGTGIETQAPITIFNSTISGNVPGGASAQGTAIRFEAGSGGFVLNSTIADNGGASQVHADTGVTVAMLSTLVAAPRGGVNCSTNAGGVLGSGGSSLDSGNTCGFTDPTDLVNTNPLLGPLGSNGGPTQTHALLTGSPAVDKGQNPFSLPNDQRGAGFPRLVGAAPDIGAFEGTVAPATVAPAITSAPPGGGSVGNAYTFAYAATGTPAPTFAVTGGALPPGLTLSPAGALTGTPSAAGTFTGTVTASNGTLPDATQAFSITIAAAPVGATVTPVPALGEGALILLAALLAALGVRATRRA